MTVFNPDGTSYHAGKEIFAGGIEIPTVDGGKIVIEDETILFYDSDGNILGGNLVLDGALGFFITNENGSIWQDPTGFKILDAEGNVVTEFNYDGTSYHAGLETFAGGARFPNADGGETWVDEAGIRIYDSEGNEKLVVGTDGSIRTPTDGDGLITIDENGITIYDAEGNVVTQFAPDGTSYHAGKEVFAGGIKVTAPATVTQPGSSTSIEGGTSTHSDDGENPDWCKVSPDGMEAEDSEGNSIIIEPGGVQIRPWNPEKPRTSITAGEFRASTPEEDEQEFSNSTRVTPDGGNYRNSDGYSSGYGRSGIHVRNNDDNPDSFCHIFVMFRNNFFVVETLEESGYKMAEASNKYYYEDGFTIRGSTIYLNDVEFQVLPCPPTTAGPGNTSITSSNIRVNNIDGSVNGLFGFLPNEEGQDEFKIDLNDPWLRTLINPGKILLEDEEGNSSSSFSAGNAKWNVDSFFDITYRIDLGTTPSSENSGLIELETPKGVLKSGFDEESPTQIIEDNDGNSNTSTASSIYIEIEGIPGESNDQSTRAKAGEIEIQSWSWGESNPSTAKIHGGKFDLKDGAGEAGIYVKFDGVDGESQDKKTDVKAGSILIENLEEDSFDPMFEVKNSDGSIFTLYPDGYVEGKNAFFQQLNSTSLGVEGNISGNNGNFGGNLSAGGKAEAKTLVVNPDELNLEGELALEVFGDAFVNGTFCADDICEDSDVRLKRDFAPINNATDLISQIKGYYHYWINPNNQERQIGVIAQELEKIFPELVHTKDDGFKAVNYSKLTAVLIEAFKEQQAEIDDLQKQVNSLKQQADNYDTLKSENEQLSKEISEMRTMMKYIIDQMQNEPSGILKTENINE